MGEKVTSRGGGAIVKHMARLDPRPGSDAGRFGGANMPDRHESGRSRGTGDERRSAYSVLTLVRAFGVSPVMRPPRRRANGYAACIGSGTVGCSRHGERPRHAKHYSPLTSSHREPIIILKSQHLHGYTPIQPGFHEYHESSIPVSIHAPVRD